MCGCVFRVEGPDGVGPYNSPHAKKYGSHEKVWAEEWHGIENGRPHFTESGLWAKCRAEGIDITKTLFGFTSMEQLERWFTPVELDMLSEMGFSIVVREAVKIISDDYQCVFIPAD